MTSLFFAVAIVGGTLSGTVTDSLTHRPVVGVDVAVDGRILASTGANGEYQVAITTAGSHLVRFTHPRFRPVLEGLEYTVEVTDGAAPTQLDVRWPSFEDLVRRQCRGEGQERPEAIVGSLQGSATVESGTLVEARWSQRDNDRPGRLYGFGSVAAPVRADGSFLICRPPSSGEVELVVKVGQLSGPIRTVSMHPGAIVEVSLRSPGR